jgi:CheY-like chemotaxis protein
MTYKSNLRLKHEHFKNIPLVLIVDDNFDNLLFVSCILESLSIKHLIAQNSHNAIDLAMDRVPDLILLDMVMPHIDGMEVTRLLKKNPQTAHIPIIAVTGLTLPEHQAEIMAAGCEDYLSKPFLIDDLEAKLARFLKPF